MEQSNQRRRPIVSVTIEPPKLNPRHQWEVCRKVTIMVDSRSSHNIMHPRMAEFLGLPMVSIKLFSVVVGNEQTITCDGLCEHVLVTLEYQQFLK
jgi:hypothetical protein